MGALRTVFLQDAHRLSLELASEVEFRQPCRVAAELSCGTRFLVDRKTSVDFRHDLVVRLNHVLCS